MDSSVHKIITDIMGLIRKKSGGFGIAATIALFYVNQAD